MDSGRPDVGSTLERGADSTGGLHSILQQEEESCIFIVFDLFHILFLYTDKSEAQNSTDYPVTKAESTAHISCKIISFLPKTLAHLNVSSDLLLSQFPTGPADSH